MLIHKEVGIHTQEWHFKKIVVNFKSFVLKLEGVKDPLNPGPLKGETVWRE